MECSTVYGETFLWTERRQIHPSLSDRGCFCHLLYTSCVSVHILSIDRHRGCILHPSVYRHGKFRKMAISHCICYPFVYRQKDSRYSETHHVKSTLSYMLYLPRTISRGLGGRLCVPSTSAAVAHLCKSNITI